MKAVLILSPSNITVPHDSGSAKNQITYLAIPYNLLANYLRTRAKQPTINNLSQIYFQNRQIVERLLHGRILPHKLKVFHQFEIALTGTLL